MRNLTRSGAYRWRAIAVVVFAGLMLTACASSGSATSDTVTPAAGGTSSAPVAASTVVMAKSGPLGTYLTDSAGKTLYLFVADTSSTSTCTGQCAKAWPPLTTTGAPTAGSGATASMLSTTTRADGSTQVVYNGHPLYYFEGDKAAGDTTGQGLNAAGALWWVVAPGGTAIQTTAPASSSPSSGGGGWS